eukprot:SAG31_NODE_12000_length_978_cov_1.705347_2_plen_60_part_01
MVTKSATKFSMLKLLLINLVLEQSDIPLEVREGQRGALRLRRLASGLALVVVRTPRVPRA